MRLKLVKEAIGWPHINQKLMKTPLSIVLFLLSSFAFAQQDTTTIFQLPKGYYTDPLRADWTKKLSQQNGLWVVSLHGKKGVLREKISFEDKNLEVRKGPYVFYENGYVKEEGQYDKGYKVGEWKYYGAKQQLLEKINYSWGNRNGVYKAYWTNEQLKSEGNYINEKPVGIWQHFYRNGELAIKENHNELGEVTGGLYFDQHRKVLSHLNVVEAPSYPGGMPAFYEYVKRSMKYPAAAIKNKIETTVVLSFLVNKEGQLSEVKAIPNPDASTAMVNEAIRLIKDSGKWIPGKELGETVDLRQLISIKFSLTN